MESHRVLVNDLDLFYNGIGVEAPELEGVVAEIRGLAPTTLVVRALGVAPAIPVELDRIGVECLSVLEFDAVSEREGLREAPFLGLGYLGGKRWHQLEAIGREVEKGVEDLAGDPEGLAVRSIYGVQRHGVGPTAEDERVATRASTTAARYGSTAPATGHAEQGRACQARPAEP
jgi:hypothetical protein